MRNLDPDGVKWTGMIRALLNNIKRQTEERVRTERRSKHPQFLGRCRKEEGGAAVMAQDNRRGGGAISKGRNAQTKGDETP